MVTKIPGLEYDEAALVEICQRWHITKLQLFGSQARGEARPDSDVDLMVSFGPESHISLWDFVYLIEEFKVLFARDVDLLTDQPIENPYRRRSIERDLRTIYAA